MSLSRWTLATMVWFLIISGASAKEAPAPDPLFQSTDILDVRIVAPLSTILSERPFEDELPATFQFTNSAGEVVALDIKMRTRGRFRRQKDICKFPPLRLNFVASQTKGTLFHKQDKVKLVTHCQATSRYEQVVLREYFAYRILNVMTDASFRVRLLRITYVDSEGKKKEDVRYGFIIENKDRLARRIEKPVLDIPETRVSALDSDYTNLASVFQYLIGNTDFSPIQGLEGEPCCHNFVLFGNEGEPIWSVPYDFDQSGLVDAPHAGPNPRFKLRNVQERLYRGRCVNNNRLDATIASYNSKHDEILQVIAEIEAVSSQSVRFMTSYIEDFYSVLNSEKYVNREFIKACI
ncbi:MAG: hypothetical protein MUO51_00395 [Woeseiaceae bacterium]|nr:hypothetical protein [Woeseiaceae bacterium]